MREQHDEINFEFDPAYLGQVYVFDKKTKTIERRSFDLSEIVKIVLEEIINQLIQLN